MAGIRLAVPTQDEIFKAGTFPAKGGGMKKLSLLSNVPMLYRDLNLCIGCRGVTC